MCSIVVIGAGAITEQFYLPALASNQEKLSKVTIVDKDLERAKRLSNKILNCEAAKVYENEIGKADGAIIALPNQLHYEATKKCVDNRTHVLCEKPFVQSYEEAQELIQVSGKRNVEVLVNNTRRLYPNFQKVKRLIKNDVIGDILSIDWVEGEEFSWPSQSGYYFDGSTGNGVIADRGSHALDLLDWWTGNDNDLRVVKCEDDSRGGAEAYAEITLSSDEGMSARITLNWLGRLHNECCIRGEKGKLFFEPYNWKWLRVEKNSRSDKKWPGKSISSYSQIGGRLVSNFLEVMSGREEPLISAGDIAQSIKLVNTCYKVRENTNQPWMDLHNE